MWGQLVRNAREWIRLTAVYFPKELHPESLAYVQVQLCLSACVHTAALCSIIQVARSHKIRGVCAS